MTRQVGSIGDIEDSVGRATTLGAATWFTLPSRGRYPFEITRGPDGNMWFTEEGTGNVGRVTPAGIITEFPVAPAMTVDAALRSIVTGSDGNLWVTAAESNKIVRITPDGSTVTDFSIPSLNTQPEGITVGTDGNVWFTEYRGKRLGRITPGGTITEFDIPLPAGYPTGITVGPDGNLWFTQTDAASLGEGNCVTRFKM